MITYEEIEKLRSSLAPDDSVLSVYLRVPADQAEVRALSRRAINLMMGAAARTPGQLRDEDAQQVLRTVAAQASDRLDTTLGIFVSGQLGLNQVVPLPAGLPERAVLAVRPHVRPLLAALQRHPDHRIVIIDHRRAWLLAVAGDRVETVATIPADRMPRDGFGGWFLEPSHGLERVTELTAHLYQDAAAILDRQARYGGSQPIVIGGYADSVTHLLALLPRAVLTSYAGGFAADPHELTLASARQLAAPVLAHWAERRERQLVQELTTPAQGVRVAIGLDDSLAAVNTGDADLLLIPDDPIVPGFHCERCDVLTRTSDGCCDWGAASRPVADLLEEMTTRLQHEGEQVVSARTLPCEAVARLR